MVDHREALGTSWHDSAWIPTLSANNVMDYFSERSNPFYDRTCNNEVIKMQRINPDQLHNMVGLEYTLLHVQEPILYVIRKEYRHSPSQVTPLADYYIIAGKVYQVPDLSSVINSRLTSAINHLQEAFEETRSFSRYQPSKGYTFQFKQQDGQEPESKKRKETEKELASVFQTQRVDLLLADLARKFPPKMPQPPPPQPGDVEVKQEVKVEKADSVASGGGGQPAVSTAASAYTSAGLAPTTASAAATAAPAAGGGGANASAPAAAAAPAAADIKPKAQQPPDKKPRLG